MKTAILALTFLATSPSGCDPPEPPMPLHTKPRSVEGGGYRFSVTKLDTFEDDLAYDGERAIYIIKDNETGKEFVGVSGIGISELGEHVSGEATVSDER